MEKCLTVALDVVQNDDRITVHATLPGVRPDEVEVSIDDDVLTINGRTSSEQEQADGRYLVRERRTGSFHRSLRLPDTVDVDKAESIYQNGVLSITLPKQEGKKPKQLKIEVRDQGKAVEGTKK